MEFALDQGSASYRIKSYQNGMITIFKQTESEDLTHPFVIMPEKLIYPWSPKTFEELSSEDFQAFLEFKPQVILLGTGEKMRFLKAELFASLAQNNIGIEVMTTAAACRTYTVLMSEGRNVAAALFP